jgi:DNA-binding response OmpR family regulator
MASLSFTCLSCRAMNDNETNPTQRILLVAVDDDRRRLDTNVLLQHGYLVDVVEDGVPAWAALTAKSYELLIIEQDLPHMSGVDLLKKLHGTHMAMPVIMIATSLPNEEFVRYPWIKPSATLCKPYAAQELLNTVQAVLRVLGAFHKPVPTIARFQSLLSHPSIDRCGLDG